MLTLLRTSILFFAKNRYRREMLLVILLKLLGLFLLWKFCFSHPLSHTLTTDTLAKHYLEETVDSTSI